MLRAGEAGAVACVVIKSRFCLPLLVSRSVGRSVGPREGKVMHHRGCMVWLVPNYEDTGSYPLIRSELIWESSRISSRYKAGPHFSRALIRSSGKGRNWS